KLIEHARQSPQRVSIVVFGLVNFGSYFKGREEAEQLRARDSTLYPYLEGTYKYLISFHPDYREHLIRLAEMVNDEMRSVVDEFNCELSANTTIQLRYSDALSTADLSRAELLHPVDGWHASVAGHNVLAEAAFRDLAPSLEFLGIARSATSALSDARLFRASCDNLNALAGFAAIPRRAIFAGSRQCRPGAQLDRNRPRQRARVRDRTPADC